MGFYININNSIEQFNGCEYQYPFNIIPINSRSLVHTTKYTYDMCQANIVSSFNEFKRNKIKKKQ